jgi:hypothetical protein
MNDRDAICINKKWDLMGSESETNRNGDTIFGDAICCFKLWDEYGRHFFREFFMGIICSKWGFIRDIIGIY